MKNILFFLMISLASLATYADENLKKGIEAEYIMISHDDEKTTYISKTFDKEENIFTFLNFYEGSHESSMYVMKFDSEFTAFDILAMAFFDKDGNNTGESGPTGESDLTPVEEGTLCHYYATMATYLKAHGPDSLREFILRVY